MNPKKARMKIAAHLTGARVDPAELRAACEVAGQHAELLRFLDEELGFSGDLETACDLFHSRAAEFSELSRRAQRRDFPLLFEHLEVCTDCRDAYASLRSTWVERAAETIGRRVRKWRTSEPLELVTNAVGRFRQIGGFPAWHELVPADARLSAPIEDEGTPGTQVREWRFELADVGVLCVVATALEPQGIGITLHLDPEGGGPVDLSRIGVEVRATDSPAPEQAGDLALFERNPIVLSSGEWILAITSEAGGLARGWEIELSLDAVGNAPQ